MATSTSPLAYDDCFEALDRALKSERGIRITCADSDSAYHLRNRLNYARRADRKANADIYERGDPMHGTSQYDSLVVRLRLGDGKAVVLIEKIKLTNQIEEI